MSFSTGLFWRSSTPPHYALDCESGPLQAERVQRPKGLDVFSTIRSCGTTNKNQYQEEDKAEVESEKERELKLLYILLLFLRGNPRRHLNKSSQMRAIYIRRIESFYGCRAT